MPVNSWLPLAHPVAPTNVSALLSAVIVKSGIYGIMRCNLEPASNKRSIPGLIVLIVGSLSALIGILYATVRAETKRLLADSTIENMGIVAAGIGAAMTFLASGYQRRPPPRRSLPPPPEAFWRGTRDHDVSQNIEALLTSIEGAPLTPSLILAAVPARTSRPLVALAISQLGSMVLGLSFLWRVAIAAAKSGIRIF